MLPIVRNTPDEKWETAVAEPGGLAPLGEELPQSAAALAVELRTLFLGLDTSLTRYAARVNLDKSAVSRYFSGERTPRWAFVHGLLVASTFKRAGVPPTREVISHLRDLHQAASQADGSLVNRINVLQESLTAADTMAQRAQRREHELEQDLDSARHRVAELEVWHKELQDDSCRSAEQYAAELTRHRTEAQDERDALIAEIARLTCELEEAHRRRIDAEKRCQDLENQLDILPTVYELEDTVDLRRERAADLEGRFRQAQAVPTPTLQGLIPAAEEIIALALMPPDQAAAVLAGMDALPACVALNQMGTFRAGRVLSILGTPTATEVISLMDAARSSAVLDEMDQNVAVEVLGRLVPQHAARRLNNMSLRGAVAALGTMDRAHAALVVSLMDLVQCAAVLGHLDPALATWIMGRLDPQRAAAVTTLRGLQLEIVHPQ